MKKILRNIKSIDRQIHHIEDAIKTLPELPYYKVFGKAGELERDLENYKFRLKQLYSEKSAAMDSLIQAANLVKADVSLKERDLVIKDFRNAS